MPRETISSVKHEAMCPYCERMAPTVPGKKSLFRKEPDTFKMHNDKATAFIPWPSNCPCEGTGTPVSR